MPPSQGDNYCHGLPGPTFNCINKELRKFHSYSHNTIAQAIVVVFAWPVLR